MIINVQIHHKSKGIESTQWDISSNIFDNIVAIMKNNYKCNLLIKNDNAGQSKRLISGKPVEFTSIDIRANYGYRVWYKGSKIVVIPNA